MGELDVQLAGKSLADHTNTQLRLALGAVLYTNTADMWRKYLNQMGYSGDIAQMLQKYYSDYSVPQNMRNYINAGAFVYTPQQLFRDGSKGVFYDNNDLTTMFVDAAGTTPATVNGLVGLQLDKSANLALGAELLSTGAVGLTGSATVATYNTGTGAGTVTRVDGANQSFVTFTGLSATTFYQVTIQNTGSNILSFRQGTFASTILGDIGVGETKTFLGLATISQLTITMSPAAGSGSFTVVSFKAQSGNHRYQTTTGSKPILRGTPIGANLVTNGDFATDVSGWVVSTGTNNVVWSAGTALSTMLITGQGVLRTSVPTVAGKTYRRRMTVLSNTLSGTLFLNIRDVTSNAVIVTNSLTTGTTGTFDIYFTATGSSTWIEATTGSPVNAGGTYSIDNVSVFDVSAGSVTAPYGLQYDGVDDFLRTASVNFSATDKMFVCAGVRKLSDAIAFGMVCETSTDLNSNNGGFYVVAPNQASTPSFGFVSKGTTQSAAVATPGYPAPYLGVVCGIGSISGDSAIIRVNGVQASSSATDQGTGNYGNYALYFGRRGGALLPFNGLDFGFVIVGKTLTATQISQAERFIAQRTGVTL